MISLHLVLTGPSAGLREPPPAWAWQSALTPSTVWRPTVHRGVADFLAVLPGLPAGDADGGGGGTQVLFHAPDGIEEVLHALRGLEGAPPWPVAVVGPPLDAAAHRALAEAGVQAWNEGGGVVDAADAGDALDAASLHALVERCGARWRREAALRSELVQLRTRMDERKWVDKAKGLLMLSRSMAEDEAFALLRRTAMHANLRLGEVSRAVVDAAQWAEAVNRAGQLRMLSQRLARLAAQVLAGVEATRSHESRRAATARVEDNLAYLARLAPEPAADAARARVVRAWKTLVAAWPARTPPRDMAAIDAAAEALLQGAEALADALQAASGRRALRIVNLCGRQRMLAERIAKIALLPAPQPPAGSAPLQEAAQAFEDALVELEQAPLTSPEVRAALATARDEWLRLARSLQQLGRPQGGVALARSAEALVDTFDQLAAQYERSLQVILS